jgi:ferritin-like metal-binding protein YciE
MVRLAMPPPYQQDGKDTAMPSKKSITTLEDLFLHTLQDIYFAENQITKALPLMAKKAGNAQLKEGFETHLAETKEQIVRLESVFKKLGKKAAGAECPAIEGIIEEAQELMSEIGDQHVLDTAMAAAAQAVEHYEISRYGTLIALAKQLGHDDCVKPLQETLAEEKATDAKLTKLSESASFKQAA